MITTEQIKELRDRTGISIAQCKKALEEVNGDMALALDALKAKGAEIADKKSDRTLNAGTVQSYIHSNGTLGVLVELSSETDFVSKNAEFVDLARDLAMQIAAVGPENVAELLEQPFIKDSSLTIDQLVKNYIQKFGERIVINRFARFDLAKTAE